jgi:uncharacterized protein DUF3106
MRLALQFAGALLLAAASGVSSDQKAKPAPPPKTAAKPAPKNPGKAGGAPKKGGGGLYNPLNPVQRLWQMTPEQRERVLEQLPPERQAQMRQQLEKFDSLPAAQKERLSRLAQPLTALPPAKQRIVYQGIVGINHLPEDRKKPVRQELLSLLEMSKEERAARLASDEFKTKYSRQEQKILSDLSTNLPADYPIAGRH